MSFKTEITETPGPIGVLLMAYGSPNTLDDVLPYYTDVRGGHAPSPEQLAIVYDHYARIGGPSGLLAISEAQAADLQARLDALASGAYRVYLGMRHWRPFIADVVRQMAADGVSRAVAIPLTPHDSRISVGGYIASVEQALEARAQEGRETGAPALRFTFVRSWRDEPHFLDLLANRIREARASLFSPDELAGLRVIFTAHSLPQRILTWNDVYPAELRATVEGVVWRLGLTQMQWTFAYQSAGRTQEPWLGPAVQDVIAQLGASGVRAALICPIGFITDNLEIRYDLDIDLREQAARANVHMERIALPNADPLLIEALASITMHAADTLARTAP